MFEFFSEAIKKRLPLLMLLVGSGCLLLASIMAKTIMDAYEYGVFALFLTILSVLNSFGLFGAEQAFLRVSKVEGRIVYAKKGDIFLLLLFGGMSVIAVLGFLSIKDFDVLTNACIALTSVLAIANMFLYNFYRLNSLFNFSQAISNLWKLAVAVVIIFTAIFRIDNPLHLVIGSIMMTMMIINVIAIVRLKSYILIEAGWSGTGYVWGYLFSMGVLTIIANIDRFLIDMYFGVKEFGNYFYIISVFLSPFLVIASYVGFSSLGKYKKNFQLSDFWRSLFVIGAYAVCGVTVYYFLIQFIVELGWIVSPFTEDALVPILILMMAVVRLCYSALSAAMGAVGTLPHIYTSNGLSLAATSLGTAFVIYNDFQISILLITVVVLLLWMIRLGLYAWAIRGGYEAEV